MGGVEGSWWKLEGIIKLFFNVSSHTTEGDDNAVCSACFIYILDNFYQIVNLVLNIRGCIYTSQKHGHGNVKKLQSISIFLSAFLRNYFSCI